jgi:hypothetical protein
MELLTVVNVNAGETQSVTFRSNLNKNVEYRGKNVRNETQCRVMDTFAKKTARDME